VRGRRAWDIGRRVDDDRWRRLRTPSASGVRVHCTPSARRSRRRSHYIGTASLLTHHLHSSVVRRHHAAICHDDVRQVGLTRRSFARTARRMDAVRRASRRRMAPCRPGSACKNRVTNQPSRCLCSLKAAFHDTDTDILARISAKMLVSVSWNAGLTRWSTSNDDVLVRAQTLFQTFQTDITHLFLSYLALLGLHHWIHVKIYTALSHESTDRRPTCTMPIGQHNKNKKIKKMHVILPPIIWTECNMWWHKLGRALWWDWDPVRRGCDQAQRTQFRWNWGQTRWGEMSQWYKHPFQATSTSYQSEKCETINVSAHIRKSSFTLLQRVCEQKQQCCVCGPWQLNHDEADDCRPRCQTVPWCCSGSRHWG